MSLLFAWAVRDGDVAPVDICESDFDKDGDVDSSDVAGFLDDFGRSPFFNPCPACVPGAWCADDSCAGYCDSQAPNGCWCDAGCVARGDCCSNACAYCGYCP